MTHAPALPSELTIYTVGELLPLWLGWLASVRDDDANGAASDEAFAVDAAAPDEVDAAGVQLLLSLSHALAHEHRLLRLLNPSRPLAMACAGLGLSGLLGGAEPVGAAT